MDLRVMVWGEPFVVSVCQKHKTVWIAVADYMGQRLESKGSSARSAAAHWAAAAKYKGG